MSTNELVRLLRDSVSVECPIILRESSVLVIMPDESQAEFFSDSLAHLRRVYSEIHNNKIRIPFDANGQTFYA